ncbi:MAG: bifunctional 23S rRNA (guanine(2069)-N(7))-methyltransferase RlmK/23S rRNA (guanine(2445)-N(2))-methyltransferase RlmL, partial [Spirochaetaceae bacterium]|nr:bifunctional 23S rRNA (guanine(2069)-N(7))-methyltransferase RlmK/23S rRNA (guanine(2445)-N(2))-methyltransferase RlmL [Spirochaetaceae bacterium]
MVFFATCATNQQDILEKEIKALGVEEAIVSAGGVEFEGTLEQAYNFCLYTRVSSKLMLNLFEDDDIQNADELYDSAVQIPWEEYLTPETTFSISQTVISCSWLKNGHFAAVRLKDAIVDRIREKFDGERPNVDKDNADVSFHIHVKGNQISYLVDFSGKTLHKRGYRKSFIDAAMRETLAATVLKRSEFRRVLESEEELEVIPTLLDPFCGSGTILIEAALWISKVAPGLIDVDRFSFYRLPLHDEAVWKKVLDAAILEEEKGIEKEYKFYGWDIDPKSIEVAKKNAQAAGVLDKIQFEVKDFTKITQEDVPSSTGYIVTDPPYGIRLADNQIDLLYQSIGKQLNSFFGGWNVSIICGEQELLSFINMKPNRTNSVNNGGIDCQIAHYYVFSDEEREEMTRKAIDKKAERLATPLSDGAQMAYNRLVKNLEALKPIMEKEGVTNYRIYDADMPEYSAAIDIYGNQFINLQEYAAPSSIPEEDAQRRLEELIFATERATGIDIDNIFVKSRTPQKGANQYNKIANKNRFYIMKENGSKYLVNFQDYLDTGVFLDHRPVRKLISEMSEGKRFLNLFCYTGTATIQAAKGGALSTVSVDSSATYLDWAESNMELNAYKGMNHFYYKEDCMSFLYNTHDKYDLIFCDPPTFSNSKGRDSFDVDSDHKRLIHLCMRHLDENGVLIFSNNYRKFKLDEYIYQDYDVKNISLDTIGEDFKRDLKIHQCYLITERKIVKLNNKTKITVKRKVAGSTDLDASYVEETISEAEVISTPEVIS